MAVHRASQLKPLTWDNVVIGEELGPVEAVLSEHKVRSHAFAVDDYGDWYLRTSPFGGPIGHPTLLADDLLKLYTLNYDVRPPVVVGLHSRNEFEFLQPIRIGQPIVLRGRHTEKYQKRGQYYRILEGEVEDDRGRLLQRMRATVMVGERARSEEDRKANSEPSGDRITGTVPVGTPEAHRAGPDVPEGAVLPAVTKTTSLEQSIIFSGFPYGWAEGGSREMLRWFHTDPDYARSQGLPDAVVQGLITSSYLSELCTNFYGPAWLTTGRLSIVFTRPVYVRDTVTATGMVKRRVVDADGPRLELELWCKNQQDQLVSVGRASARVE